MENESINVVELFSGIGSQVKALKNLNLNVNIVATCEWDLHAIIAYDYIHNSEPIPLEIENMTKVELLERLGCYTFSNSGKEALPEDNLRTYSEEVLRRLYTAIIRNSNYVDVNSLRGKDLNESIDILTYSFPCQDLSNVGAFHGYNKGIEKDSGSRSSLLWQVGRILSEMKMNRQTMPRFLVMENVPALLSKRHFKDFSSWISELRQLGYISKYFQLNALDFGLPQNRPRLLMISVYVGENTELAETVLDYFKQTNEDEVVDTYKATEFYHPYSIEELLRIDYSDPILFDEAIECTPNDTKSRRKIWDDNPKLVLDNNRVNPEEAFIRTITTKQDRNPNSGNLFFDAGLAGKSKFRYLTPRECLLFMGFADKDYEVLKNNNLEFHKGDAIFARDKIIRLAGNSIPVKMLEGVFYQIVVLRDILAEVNDRQNDKESNDNSDAVERIKHHMFAAGIRSRLSKEPYPASADIVYPKYKTAIFVNSDFYHGHVDKYAGVDKAQHYWKNKIENICRCDELKHREAESLGWQVIVVWKNDLYGPGSKELLNIIERRVKSNLKLLPEKA